eukprot:scaffold360_cov374-Pavlova_lutheri.AAC.48
MCDDKTSDEASVWNIGGNQGEERNRHACDLVRTRRYEPACLAHQRIGMKPYAFLSTIKPPAFFTPHVMAIVASATI